MDSPEETPFMGLVSYQQLPFVRSKARQEVRCWMTGELIEKGQPSWRPLTNGKHRMRRLSDAAAKQLLEKKP